MVSAGSGSGWQGGGPGEGWISCSLWNQTEVKGSLCGGERQDRPSGSTAHAEPRASAPAVSVRNHSVLGPRCVCVCVCVCVCEEGMFLLALEWEIPGGLPRFHSHRNTKWSTYNMYNACIHNICCLWNVFIVVQIYNKWQCCQNVLFFTPVLER